MITSAGLFFVDKNDKILIGHPTHSSDGRGFWSIPKGRKEPEEASLITVVREFKEETNIDVLKYVFLFDFVFLGIQPYRTKAKQLEAFAVFYHKTITQKLKCLSMVEGKVDKDGNPFPEFDRFKWVSYETAVKMLHHSQAEILKNKLHVFKSRGSYASDR